MCAAIFLFYDNNISTSRFVLIKICLPLLSKETIKNRCFNFLPQRVAAAGEKQKEFVKKRGMQRARPYVILSTRRIFPYTVHPSLSLSPPPPPPPPFPHPSLHARGFRGSLRNFRRSGIARKLCECTRARCESRGRRDLRFSSREREKGIVLSSARVARRWTGNDKGRNENATNPGAKPRSAKGNVSCRGAIFDFTVENRSIIEANAIQDNREIERNASSQYFPINW